MTKKYDTTINSSTGELDKTLNISSYLSSIFLKLSGENADQDIDVNPYRFFAGNVDPVTNSGLQTLENWILHSGDFEQVEWTTSNTTITPEVGYTTITQDSIAQAFISQDAIPDTSGKLLTVLIVCKPVLVYKQNVKIAIEDSSGEIGIESWILPLGEYTTIRVRATRESVSNVKLNFENIDSVADFGLDIQKTQLFESVKKGIYNIGDSISLAAYDDETPPGIHSGQCYSMLYANNYFVESQQEAFGLATLDQIKTQMQSDLPGNNYPIIMIEGGGVDIINAGASPVNDMIDDIREIVELARASTDTVVLFTVPPMPVFTGAQAVWAIQYNIAILAEFADSETVTVVNLFFLTPDKFNIGVHVTLEGHVEIFEAVDAAIVLPYYVEKYKFIETEDLASEEVHNEYSSNIHIDWTNTDKTIAGTAKWGGIASGGFGGDVPVYWTVESFSNGAIVDMPRFVPHGGGFTPTQGAIANVLFIHSDVGGDPTLTFSNNDISVGASFILDEITGAFSYSPNIEGGTTWDDSFTINKTLKVVQGVIKAVATKTNNYQVLATDYSLVGDGTSNTVTFTMPSSPAAGQIWNFACLNSTFQVDVDFNGKNFYDSSGNELLFKGENLKIQYDGTQYIGC